MNQSDLALHNGQHVVFGHQQVLFAVQLDFGARVRREQDAVALLDLERAAGAVVQQFAGTEVKIDGEEYLLMPEDDVLAIVKA